jgi:hypothetical protein
MLLIPLNIVWQANVFHNIYGALWALGSGSSLLKWS